MLAPLCVYYFRYCAGKKGKGKKGKFGADFSGASHIAELHALLRATVMVSKHEHEHGHDHGPGKKENWRT